MIRGSGATVCGVPRVDCVADFACAVGACTPLYRPRRCRRQLAGSSAGRSRAAIDLQRGSPRAFRAPRRAGRVRERGGRISTSRSFSAGRHGLGSDLTDIAARLHVGASINVNGDTNRSTRPSPWNFPPMERVSLELTFGGSLHDGSMTARAAPSAVADLRGTASIGRSHATLALSHRGPHVECGLCNRNSGSPAPPRLGYVFDWRSASHNARHDRRPPKHDSARSRAPWRSKIRIAAS